MHEQSIALRQIGELAVRQGANPARTVYDQVVEALSLTERRAADAEGENIRGRVRREIEGLLTNYDAPKPDHWGSGRGDVMEWLSYALQIARGDRRERAALAAEMTKIGASPAHSVTQMFEFVIAKTRAEARSNATAHAERAAEAKINALNATIRDLTSGQEEAFRVLSGADPHPHGVGLADRVAEVMEAFRERVKVLESDKQTLLGQLGEANAAPDKIREQSLEAMSILAGHIPGVQGFTLPQKLREVLIDKDSRIAEMERVIASGKPSTVIVGADRVRAVIDRAIASEGRTSNPFVDDPGGWFLRTLAAANLAVVVYNWDGLDPTAEPVEPTVKPAGSPTLDDVKAAWGTMVTELGKIPEVLRDVLKDRP